MHPKMKRKKKREEKGGKYGIVGILRWGERNIGERIIGVWCGVVWCGEVGGGAGASARDAFVCGCMCWGLGVIG